MMENVRFSDETRFIGKPSDWLDELDGECIGISVFDYVDEQTGINFMMTGWKPTKEQLDELNNGGSLRLCISGKRHPVIKLFSVAAD